MIDCRDDEMKTPLNLAREFKAELDAPDDTETIKPVDFMKSLTNVIELLENWEPGDRQWATDLERIETRISALQFSRLGFITNTP